MYRLYLDTFLFKFVNHHGPWYMSHVNTKKCSVAPSEHSTTPGLKILKQENLLI